MGLFGPSKKEIWQKLCEEINAEYIEDGFWGNAKVKGNIDGWTIVLDTYTLSNGKTSTTYTRIRVPFVNPNKFYFKIYRCGFFSNIGKYFGMQDIEVGYEEFDNDFIIQSNDKDKVIKLLSNKRIRDLMQEQSDISLEVKDDEGCFGPNFPEYVDELYFSAPGLIKDIERLKGLYELFREVLNELCSIGSTYNEETYVKL